MTLAEIMAKILQYVSDNDKEIFMGASVDEIYEDGDGLNVIFTDGNTVDWIIK